MRELTLIETGYLAGLLLLSLLLPLLLSGRAPQDKPSRKAVMKPVWIGQALAAMGGVVVLGSVTLAPYAAAVALVSYLGCALALHRKLQAARSK